MPGFTLTRSRAILVAALGLAMVFLVSHLLSRQPAPVVSVETSAGAAATASSASPDVGLAAPAPRGLTVDVAGAVRRPGLYTLRQGTRIADAIARAGGATPKANTDLVNLAAPLADGEQVLVPAGASAGAVAGPGAATAASPSPTSPVDLNTATIEQLDALPGVGPVTAQKIVDYRQAHGSFTSVDQLDAISGIGPARIADLRGLVQP